MIVADVSDSLWVSSSKVKQFEVETRLPFAVCSIPENATIS
jgi:hypothetical protein